MFAVAATQTNAILLYLFIYCFCAVWRGACCCRDKESVREPRSRAVQVQFDVDNSQAFQSKKFYLFLRHFVDPRLHLREEREGVVVTGHLTRIWQGSTLCGKVPTIWLITMARLKVDSACHGTGTRFSMKLRGQELHLI